MAKGTLRDEAIERAAIKRRRRLGPMSDEAFEELRIQAHEYPEDFVTEAPEQAIMGLAETLEAIDHEAAHDDALDDQQYLARRTDRMERIRAASAVALAIDPHCVYGELLHIMASPLDGNGRMAALLDLDRRVAKEAPMEIPSDGSAWDRVFLRPRLRLKAAIARQGVEVASYRLARQTAEGLLDAMADDELGARYTLALVLARLEDEDALDALDARFDRHGNPWMHLARALLLYKLDHLGAARRAVKGFCQLCEGGAYVLLRPAYVETYLPDRPSVTPGSFEEVVLAVHEADPVVVDAPDFVDWCASVPGVMEEARKFAQERGFDW